MRLAIRHTTHYRFARPVVHAIQRLRLTPKSTQGQEIIAWDMRFENAEKQFAYEDQHRNSTTLISMNPGAQEVTVTCSGTIDTHDFAGVIGRHAGHLPLWSFRGQTPLTKPGAGMRGLVRDVRKEGGGSLETLHALSARIIDKVAYRTGVTGVETTAEDAWAQGCGVCQDHAHLFIGTARALGYPVALKATRPSRALYQKRTQRRTSRRVCIRHRCEARRRTASEVKSRCLLFHCMHPRSHADLLSSPRQPP